MACEVAAGVGAASTLTVKRAIGHFGDGLILPNPVIVCYKYRKSGSCALKKSMLTVSEIKKELADANRFHLAHQEWSAIESLKKVLPYQERNAAIYAQIGEAYVNMRQGKEGADWLRKALAIDPAMKACHLRIADALNVQHLFEDAESYLTRHWSLFDGDALECHWHNSMADVLKMRRQYHRAEEEFKVALHQSSNNPTILGSYAGLLALMGRHAEATRYYEDAFLALQNPITANNLAMHYLLIGEWELGWRLWERRLEEKLVPGWRCMPAVELQDRVEEPIAFFQEGGLGDLIQMARYIPLFKAVSPKQYLVVDPKLEAVARMFALDVKVVMDDNIPAHIAEVPLLSMPYRTKRFIPDGSVPPLKLNCTPIKSKRPSVCINWFGDAIFTHDDLRSAKLADFAPIVREHQNVNWFCVNVGNRVEKELRSNELKITHYPDTLANAVRRIAGADVMLTTDTGLAHVAGTLGRPTILVLRDYPDWRWGLKGETTPWYPSMRVVRWDQDTTRTEMQANVTDELDFLLEKLQ